MYEWAAGSSAALHISIGENECNQEVSTSELSSIRLRKIRIESRAITFRREKDRENVLGGRDEYLGG
jgi:hypothetical protein